MLHEATLYYLFSFRFTIPRQKILFLRFFLKKFHLVHNFYNRSGCRQGYGSSCIVFKKKRKKKREIFFSFQRMRLVDWRSNQFLQILQNVFLDYMIIKTEKVLKKKTKEKGNKMRQIFLAHIASWQNESNIGSWHILGLTHFKGNPS